MHFHMHLPLLVGESSCPAKEMLMAQGGVSSPGVLCVFGFCPGVNDVCQQRSYEEEKFLNCVCHSAYQAPITYYNNIMADRDYI